jgi:branched-chain amino acid transport system substrate-binding protein
VIGNDVRSSFEVALDPLGRKMGSLPIQVTDEDNQQRPAVAGKRLKSSSSPTT